jgi:hypothetical protein
MTDCGEALVSRDLAAGYGYPWNREPGVSLRRVLDLPSAP